MQHSWKSQTGKETTTNWVLQMSDILKSDSNINSTVLCDMSDNIFQSYLCLSKSVRDVETFTHFTVIKVNLRRIGLIL